MFKMNQTLFFFLSALFAFSTMATKELRAEERAQDFMQMELMHLEGENGPLALQGVPKLLITPQYLAMTLEDTDSKVKFALKIPRQALEKIKANLQMVKVSPFHPQFFAELKLWEEDHHHDHSFVLKRDQQRTSVVLTSYDPLSKKLEGEFAFSLESKELHHHGSHALNEEDHLLEVKSGAFRIKWE